MNLKDRNIRLLAYAVAFIILWQFVFLPGQQKLRSLTALAAQKQKDLRTLTTLAAQYQEMNVSGRSADIRTTPASFSLIAFLGDTVDRLNLKNSVKSIEPLPDAREKDLVIRRVRVGLENITIETLYGFLQKIEQQNFIYLPEFRITKNKDQPFLLNVQLELLILVNG